MNAAASPLSVTAIEEAVRTRFGPGTPAEGEHRTVVSVDDVLRGGAAWLAAGHQHLIGAEGATPAAAAHYLAGWYAGGLAGVAGFALAAWDVGLVFDDVRWSVAPEAWVDGLTLRITAVHVTSSHPLANASAPDPRIVVAADTAERDQRTLDALVIAAAPLVEACRSLARTGGKGLWNEVADRFALEVSGQRDIVGSAELIDRLLTPLLTHAGRPWSSVPELWVDAARTPSPCFGRKGGCCLAYLGTWDPAVFTVTEETDPTWAEFVRAFPHDPDRPQYCNSCSLRSLDDVAARLAFWYDHGDQ